MVLMNKCIEVVVAEQRPVHHTALVRVADGLALRTIKRQHRLIARIFSHSLDGQLAAGQAPEDRWLRAVRASVLSEQRCRQRLARTLGHVLARAEGGERRPLAGIAPRGALTHPGREVIATLIDTLQSPGPASAQGVAMAAVLLSDGTGPLYRPRSVEHLSAAVAAAIRCIQAGTQLAA